MEPRDIDNELTESLPPIDDGRLVVRDFLRANLLAGGLLILKDSMRGGLPEPFDFGNHVGNFGMTLALTAGIWAHSRNNILRHPDKASPEGYSNMRRKTWLAVAIASVAMNMAVELKPSLYQTDRLVTSDPIDVVYGVMGGVAASQMMSGRIRPRSQSPKNKSSGDQPPDNLPKRPVQPIKQNPGARKAKRKRQEISRRNNRKR